MYKRWGVAWRNPASGILRSRTVFRTCDRIPTFSWQTFSLLSLCSERKECQWKADAPKWIQNGTKMAREGGGTEEEHSLRSNSRLSREANSIWHCARWSPGKKIKRISQRPSGRKETRSEDKNEKHEVLGSSFPTVFQSAVNRVNKITFGSWPAELERNEVVFERLSFMTWWFYESL